ncbi:M56 family metallopeptidase, partial [Streptomyces sp. NPDC054838]
MTAGNELDGRPRIDERVLGAGTGPRFVTLLLLMLTAGGSLMLSVYRTFGAGYEAKCSLAAGVDPADGSYWAATLSITGQGTAYRLCMHTWAPPPPGWQLAIWPLVLVLAAGLLFAVLPLWRTRRGRVVTLESVDPDGDIRTLLGELCTAIGLARPPSVVIDPANSSVGAVVFGRTRRPVVCLHGGLVAIRSTDPERFRAVLLHELAHIANRDVTLTYLTVALWRVFLALVLLPYTCSWAYDVSGIVADGGTPRLSRNAAFAVIMVVMVHLARADALRSREIYADLTALRWGADPHGWSVSVTPPGSRVRRALDGVLDLWRTHPRWGLRQGALTDPGPLFRTSALPVFLLGTIPVLTVPQVLGQIAPYRVNFTNNLMAVLVVLPGALVSGVIVVALWRSVVYAVLTGTKVPSGAWTGGWLGAGMSAGLFLSGFAAGWSWLPLRPQVLLLPVVVGALFAWWTTQCARLWIGTARGRTLRPALALCLAAACLGMTSWLAWWMLTGTTALNVPLFTAQFVAKAILRWLPSAAPTGDLAGIPGIAVVHPQLSALADTPMAAMAMTALWAVPLLAWASGPVAGAPRWLPDATAAPERAPAPLRAVLLPGLLGGALACLAVIGVQAYVHTAQPAPDGRGGLYALRYAVLLLLVLCLPAAAAAVVASTADRRFRLLGSLIAAQTATLIGLAAMSLLVSVDGCITSLNVLSESCAWRPAWSRPLFPFVYVMTNALVLASVLAVAIALAAASVGHRRPRRARVTGRTGMRTSPSTTGRPRARRVAAGVLAALVIAATATDGAVQQYRLGFTIDALAAERKIVQDWNLPDPPVSDSTRLRQIRAWYRLGGYAVIGLVVSYDDQLTNTLREAQAAKDSGDVFERRLRPTCKNSGGASLFETVWFRVPAYPQIRADWHAVVTLSETGSRDCTRGLDAHDVQAVGAALAKLRTARRCAEAVNAQIDRIL